MTGAGSGGGGGYDYVEASYPSGADEGESLYHLTENAAFVYSGTEWIEQTVTDHSQLSGVNEGDHRGDSRVSELAPVQSVDGSTGDVQAVPSGIITMWSGTTSDVPSGWTLCDGTDGAPDLTDRFVAGAGGQYSAGDTGGADSVSLTASQNGPHSHSIQHCEEFGDDRYNEAVVTGNKNSPDISTGSSGSGEPHENRPPFYALAFIMKV